jgi:hypothetical protein
MPIRYVDRPPQEVDYSPAGEDIADRMSPADVEHVAEIFKTPLTGAFTWDYEEADRKIRRLYRLGKKLNWDAEMDIGWDRTFPKTESPTIEQANPFEGWEPFDALSGAQQLDFAWHSQAWMLSQFLHGEQGALLVASQLVSCAPTYEAKLYAASQTFDEARHVEVFAKYLKEKIGFVYPINPNLKALLDKILTDERWDLKFIGMQLIVEGLALAAFNTQKMVSRDPLLKDILELVQRDEARHVAFGVTYMEQFVKTLSERELEDRAMFAYEACVVMRERLIGGEVLSHFGLDADAGREKVLSSPIMADFRNLLFTRIMPNLKKVGLLTDAVRPLYDGLGILEYEDLVDDSEIDWANMEAPLIMPRESAAE